MLTVKQQKQLEEEFDCEVATYIYYLAHAFVRSVRQGKDKRRVDYRLAKHEDLVKGNTLYWRKPDKTYKAFVCEIGKGVFWK